MTTTRTTAQTTEQDEIRDILLDAQSRLDYFFFGPDPYYAEVAKNAKLFYPDRTDQLVLLLSIFATKDHNRIQLGREQFIKQLLAQVDTELADV